MVRRLNNANLKTSIENNNNCNIMWNIICQ